MKTKRTVQIQEEIPDTHCFVYKTKKYPINFNLFLYSSKYFHKNQNFLQQNKFIHLIDKDLECQFSIPDKIIQDFIKYNHREPIDIDDDNVSVLNYLAIKYEIDSLITFTQEHINENQKDIIIKLLVVNQNDPTIDTKSYEDFIANDILYFIKDDGLLSVNFPILYRILSRYEKVPNNELIEFYFKCLDKYGQVASILFTKVDFMHSKSEFFNRIMNKYSKIFDFHFIDFSFLKKMYDMESQLILNTNETDAKLEAQIEINKNLNNEIVTLKSKLNEHDKTIDELNKKIDSLLNELSKQKEEMNKKIDSLANEQVKQKEEINEKIETEITAKKKKIEDEIKKQENVQIIELRHQNGKEFQGIFKYLFDKVGKNIHDSGTLLISSNSIYDQHYPKYLLDYNENTCYSSNNENNSTYIRFDFKEKSVQLFSYTIKTHDRDDGAGAMKNWVVEASNDETKWDTIDKHVNDLRLK